MKIKCMRKPPGCLLKLLKSLPAGKSGLKKLALGGAFVAAMAIGSGAAYTGKLGGHVWG